MCRCVFAIKPKLAGGPANVTRNVVFHEVLEGVSQPVPAVQTPSVAEARPAAVQEVEDISEWNDYDAIEAEMEHELDEDAVTEEMPLSQEETRRRVEAGRKTPATRQRRPSAQSLAAAPPVPEYEPSCEYERIRDDNVAEFRSKYLETFGVPWGQQNGLLEQTLFQPDIEEGEDEMAAASVESGEEEQE